MDDDCAAVEELLLLLVEAAALEFDAFALLVDSACCELAAWLDALWFAFEVEVAAWLLVD